MKTKLTILGLDVEMEEPHELLFNYLDGFFDFNTLLHYVHLTGKGRRRYGADTIQNKIHAILMCTKYNRDFQKYNMFYLKCEEWDLYFNELFLGFDRTDVNIAIAKLVARDSEKIKRGEYGV
jgi:hypothetical protein